MLIEMVCVAFISNDVNSRTRDIARKVSQHKPDEKKILELGT